MATGGKETKTDVHGLAMHKPIIMPDMFNGSEEEWEYWYANFENCADINGWDDATKLKFLAVSLKGSAQRVFMDLDAGVRKDLARTVEALATRFRSAKDPELYKSMFLSRKRVPGESLSTLGNEIRVLAGKAYIGIRSDVRDELARDQFIRALDNPKLVLELRHHLPTTLDGAVRKAIEWENVEGEHNSLRAGAFVAGEAAGCHPSQYKRQESETGELITMMKEMMTMMKENNTNYYRKNQTRGASRSSGPDTCWQCGEIGHRKSECTLATCWECGQRGHLRRDCRNVKHSGNENRLK